MAAAHPLNLTNGLQYLENITDAMHLMSEIFNYKYTFHFLHMRVFEI